MNNDIVPGFDNDKNESLKIRLETIDNVPGCLIFYLDGCLVFYLTGYIDGYNEISVLILRKWTKALNKGANYAY
jgi:hypothetical protein